MMSSLVLIFILSITSCFALDEEEIEIVERFNLVQSKVRLHEDDWSSNYPKLEDKSSLNTGKFDKEVTDWKNLKEDEWLDFSRWKTQRALKDKTPNWKAVIRNRRNKEIVGRVLKCLGACSNYRGSEAASSSYMTVLREGDEFLTDENSYSWLVLVDGSILRISPKTSITLSEVNISKKTNFIVIRLNEGHIYLESRLKGKFDIINKSETDTAFYPILEKMANREHFAIRDFQGLDKEFRLLYQVKENPGHESQLESLNESLNEFDVTRDSKIFLYSPNTSVLAQNVNIDMMYTINAKSYINFSFKPLDFVLEDNREQKISAFYRGHTNRAEKKLEPSTWYEVDQNGNSINQVEEYPKTLDALKAFTRRISTIRIAREIFLKRYSSFILDESKVTVETLLNEFEYRIWDIQVGNEMEQRLEFVTEYTRRVETTNLNNIRKLFKESDGSEINNDYFRLAMSKHYDYIKNLYSDKRKLLFEMNQTQYYMWLLRYGKNEI